MSVTRKSLKINKEDDENGVGHSNQPHPLTQRVRAPIWVTLSILLELVLIFILWFVAGTTEEDYQQYLKSSVSDFDIKLSLFDIFMISILKDIVLFFIFYDIRKFKNNVIEFIGYALPISTLIYMIVKVVLMASDNFGDIHGGGAMGGAILGISGLFSLIQVASVYKAPKILQAIQYQPIENYENLDKEQKSRVDETMGKSNTSIYRVLSLVKPEYTIIFFAMIALFVNSMSQVAIPFIFGIVVDALVDGDRRPGINETDTSNTLGGFMLHVMRQDEERTPEEKLNASIVLLLIIFVIGAISGFVRGWLFTLAGQRVVARLRKDLFFAVVKQEVAFFDRTRTGELTSRLTSDTQVIQNAVTTNISMLVRYLVQILISIGILFILSWKLALVMFAVVPFVAIGAVIYGRFIQKKQKEFQDELAGATTVAEEVISNIRTVRAFSKEQKSSDKYSLAVEKSYVIGRTIALAYGIFNGVLGFIPSAAIALIFWYGGTLVLNGELSTGTLTSFLLYTLNVAFAFAFLSSLFGDFMQAVGASSRVFQLIDRVPEIPISGGTRINKMEGKVAFSGVSFTYPTRPDSKVLDNVSLELEPGKVLALVGPSGGGKSTTVSLLERFYDVTDGSVLIDGVNVKDLDPVWYRSNVALVSQEPVLFADTIKENICYGIDRSVTMQEIEEAAQKANAHNFISEFAEKYDTPVGERGVRLSGGQKQRIAIARALLMNPKILLLDEATSALDAESEYLVQEAIERAMQNRTVLVIAHRLSTVKNADIIAVLSGGTVVEKGSHHELLEKDGLYKKLVNRQLQGADDVDQVFAEITGETKRDEQKKDV